MNAPAEDGSLCRGVWRWRFHAGLIVLLFLPWLAVTGGLYLYKPEIEALVYSAFVSVTPLAGDIGLSRLRRA